MENIKVGDVLKVQCYKHDGKIHTEVEEATVLDITDDYLICANDKALITESDGSTHRTKETAIITFYKNSWFNVIAQFKKKGLLYYCNMATPYLIDGKVIKYIDYDLDLRVFADKKHKILDKKEYAYHKKKMRYPEEIDLILHKELEKLIELKQSEEGPFNHQNINKYYQQYLKIKKNEIF